MKFNLYEFINNLQTEGKLLAVDLGMKKTGIAISDAKWNFIQDYFAFKNCGIDQDLDYICEVIKKNRICGVVLGMPFSHTRCNGWLDFITEFGDMLVKKTHLPIYMKDESFSTKNIEFLIQDLSKKNQKKWKDKLAASCMLEEMLDIISEYKTHA